MISTDFAANETASDAYLSASLMLLPPKHGKKGLQALREKLAAFFPRQRHSVAFFLSGRSALFFTLNALNLPKDSEVLVQGFTCEAVILPIIHGGFKPVFVDIEEKTYGMDPRDLEKKVTSKAKVLIIQHTFGIQPNRKALLAIAKKHNLVVIEDLAHGFDPAFSTDDITSTIKLLSFGRSKAYSSVFGGAVLTTDKRLSDRLETLSAVLPVMPEGTLRKILLYKPLTVLVRGLYPIGLGKMLHKVITMTHMLIPEITKREKNGEYDTFTDYRYPETLALLLLSQLARYEETMKLRRKNVQIYNSTLSSTLETPVSPLIRYPLRVKKRSGLLQFLRKKQIFLGNWYDQVIGPKEINIQKLMYVSGACPVAERLTQEIVNLPTTVSHKNAQKLSELINSYYEN